jgi:hypothetical protein
MENRMKKLFEIDINDDFRRAIISQYFLGLFTIILCLTTATIDRSILHLSFYLELFILLGVFKFYFQAQKHRNYAYWTISFLLGLYILMDILIFTFINYDIFVLYISFLASIFLFINCYVMSSPLFFPRVQWWEYDFRYRGDLKSLIRLDDKIFEARLTDLRRNLACVEAFDYIPLGSEIKLETEFEDKIYVLKATVKTSKEIIQGRPIRYGIKFSFDEDNSKEVFKNLLHLWDKNKKVKLRNKFSEESSIEN